MIRLSEDHNKRHLTICSTFTKQTFYCLTKVIVPDPWKAGASNITEGGGRKVDENKLLTAKKNRFNPYQGEAQFRTCRICKTKVHQVNKPLCVMEDVYPFYRFRIKTQRKAPKP